MKIIQVLKNFLCFNGNIGRYSLLCLICGIELFRVAANSLYAHLSLPPYRIISILTDFPLMITVLYLYGATIAGRLNNLKLNPNLTYLWILGIWFCKYLLMPLAHTFGTMQFVYSAGVLFLLMILPLFATDRNTLLFWKPKMQ